MGGLDAIDQDLENNRTRENYSSKGVPFVWGSLRGLSVRLSCAQSLLYRIVARPRRSGCFGSTGSSFCVEKAKSLQLPGTNCLGIDCDWRSCRPCDHVYRRNASSSDLSLYSSDAVICRRAASAGILVAHTRKILQSPAGFRDAGGCAIRGGSCFEFWSAHSAHQKVGSFHTN